VHDVAHFVGPEPFIQEMGGVYFIDLFLNGLKGVMFVQERQMGGMECRMWNIGKYMMVKDIFHEWIYT